MLLRLKRTQKTALGLLRAGVPYAFDPANPAQKAVADRLLAQKLADKLTRKQLDTELEDEIARQAAAQADAAEGTRHRSALAEPADAKAAAEAKAG